MPPTPQLDAILARCDEDVGLPGVSVRLLSDDPVELASAASLLGRSFIERESMTSTLVAQDPAGRVAAEMEELAVGLVDEIAPLGCSRLQGFSGLVTEATSNSQIVFGRLGLETIASVDYARIPEFVSIPERRDNDRHPPITHARLMWAPIERAEQYDHV